MSCTKTTTIVDLLCTVHARSPETQKEICIRNYHLHQQPSRRIHPGSAPQPLPSSTDPLATKTPLQSSAVGTTFHSQMLVVAKHRQQPHSPKINPSSIDNNQHQHFVSSSFPEMNTMKCPRHRMLERLVVNGVRTVTTTRRTRCLSSTSAESGSSWLLRESSSSEEETLAIARHLGKSVLRKGDVVLLQGPVGAGKSFLTREIIRTLVKDPELVVPSPSYLLGLTYGPIPGTNTEIAHFDLYRLQNIGIKNTDWQAFGWDDMLFREDHICFIEWPQCALQLITAQHAKLRSGRLLNLQLHLDQHSSSKRFQDRESSIARIIALDLNISET